jgi:hypothetical protein
MYGETVALARLAVKPGIRSLLPPGQATVSGGMTVMQATAAKH